METNRDRISQILFDPCNLIGIEDGQNIYTRETANKITEAIVGTQFVLNEEPWQNNAGASCFVCWIDEIGKLSYIGFDILY